MQSTATPVILMFGGSSARVLYWNIDSLFDHMDLSPTMEFSIAALNPRFSAPACSAALSAWMCHPASDTSTRASGPCS